EIPPEEATRKVPESFGKCRAETLSGQRKKSKVSGRHKSRREAQSLANHLKVELEEATQRQESLEEELGEIRKRFFNSWDQLFEVKKQLSNSQSLLTKSQEELVDSRVQL
ncbi:hypothetical protein BHM03_00010835, partial [Ensete ventricosum]